jgi:hypothetical protein
MALRPETQRPAQPQHAWSSTLPYWASPPDGSTRAHHRGEARLLRLVRRRIAMRGSRARQKR